MDGPSVAERSTHLCSGAEVCETLRPVGEHLLLLGAVSHVTQLANVLSLESKSM